MKVKVTTYGEFFKMFVDVPIRTPAIIDITKDQYDLLRKIASIKGWKVELIKPIQETKPSKSKSKTPSES